MSSRDPIPETIKEKYRKGRRFTCRYKGKVVAQGIVEDYVLVTHGEYLKGVEKLRFEKDGRTEFRFMYWANKEKAGNGGSFV